MKKINFLLILVLFTVTTACSLGHEDGEKLEPFDPADWPTPVPAEVEASPTPFPKQAVELLAKQETNTDASSAPAIQAEPTATPLPSQPTATPTLLPEPVLTGVVTSEGLNVRTGPGQGYAVVDALAKGDTVEITAVDPVYGWTYVEAEEGVSGWANPFYLDLNGDLSLVSTMQPGEAGSVAPSTVGSGAGDTLLIQLRAGGDIMLINRDGSNLRRLTTGIDPALSPDGSKVAFTRWDGAGVGTVWVINADGSGERPVMTEIRQVKNPSWSPDSKRIAVNFQEGGTLEPTHQCEDVSDGSAPDINFWKAYGINTRVSFDSMGRPIVSLCWIYPADAHWKLRIIEVDSGMYQDMPAGQYAFSPTWDPANDWRVVSTAGLGLVATDVNRGEAFPLTDDPSDRAPIFSKDGQFLAVTYRQDTHWEVHRLNPDGNGRVRLTKTPLYAVVDNSPQWNNVAPVFSPDGTEIAYLTDRTGRWEVWVMGIDGSNQRPMFAESVNDQLAIEYLGNDERSLGWGE